MDVYWTPSREMVRQIVPRYGAVLGIEGLWQQEFKLWTFEDRTKPRRAWHIHI